ncbi:MAG: stage II sporulation protein D [Clostridioides sp.]|nr:stage II sporulation protein D [Clostridioides sp.]
MKNPFYIILLIVICAILCPLGLTVASYNLNSSEYFKSKDNIKEENYNSVQTENKNTSNSDENIYETINKQSPQIALYNHKTQKYENIDIEEYLVGVLAGEMSADFDLEALKAQAVAARTYVEYKMDKPYSSKHPKAAVCTDYKHCQEYKSKSELQKLNGDKWIEEKYTKLEQAVRETKGQILTYEEKPIMTLYFSTSSGKTENCEEVFASDYPYLKSVDSQYDSISPKFVSTVNVSKEKFVNAVNEKGAKVSTSNLENKIKIVENSEGGSVEKIKIGSVTLKGQDIRTMFNLNSSNFDIEVGSKNVEFNVKGYGHGVGMSQWGAEGMARQGSKYYDILLHYYTGIKIKDIY